MNERQQGYNEAILDIHFLFTSLMNAYRGGRTFKECTIILGALSDALWDRRNSVDHVEEVETKQASEKEIQEFLKEVFGTDNVIMVDFKGGYPK